MTNTAVLYLTDVFGINLTENRLLADSFARAGYVTVAPDLFNGQPAPSDLNDPGFNSTAFLAAHGPDVTDPIIDKAINYMRTSLNVTKLAVTGYCFGGRYSFRFTDPARTLRADVAFAAHPSAWVDAEVSAIGAPTAVAAGCELNSLLHVETTFCSPSPSSSRHSLACGFEGSSRGAPPEYQLSVPSGFVQWSAAWIWCEDQRHRPSAALREGDCFCSGCQMVQQLLNADHGGNYVIRSHQGRGWVFMVLHIQCEFLCSK